VGDVCRVSSILKTPPLDKSESVVSSDCAVFYPSVATRWPILYMVDRPVRVEDAWRSPARGGSSWLVANAYNHVFISLLGLGNTLMNRMYCSLTIADRCHMGYSKGS